MRTITPVGRRPVIVEAIDAVAGDARLPLRWICGTRVARRSRRMERRGGAEARSLAIAMPRGRCADRADGRLPASICAMSVPARGTALSHATARVACSLRTVPHRAPLRVRHSSAHCPTAAFASICAEPLAREMRERPPNRAGSALRITTRLTRRRRRQPGERRSGQLCSKRFRCAEGLPSAPRQTRLCAPVM